jgi:hypothetical protein
MRLEAPGSLTASQGVLHSWFTEAIPRAETLGLLLFLYIVNPGAMYNFLVRDNRYRYGHLRLGAKEQAVNCLPHLCS